MLHELFDDSVPFAGDGMSDPIGAVRIDVDNVAKLGDPRNLVEEIHREAVEAIVARKVLTVIQHDVGTLLKCPAGRPARVFFLSCTRHK